MNWMNLPEEFSNENSKFVILPIEYEHNVTFGCGCKKGSFEIIKASKHLEYFEDQYNCEPFLKGIKVLNPINSNDPKDMVEKVNEKIEDKFMIGIGGDHAITIGMIKGIEKFNDNFSVIILDAHSDFRYSWNNSELNHACVSRRIFKNHSICLVGVRSMDKDEAIEIEKTENVHLIKAYDFSIDNFEKIIEKLEKNVYISIDVDVFDPSFIRNTGTPEPGGFNWYEVISILEKIFEKKNVIGCDLVEFAPNCNYLSESYSLARLLYKIMALKSK